MRSERYGSSLPPVLWRQFPARAQRILGRSPRADERLSSDDLIALGLDQAAIGVRTNFRYRYVFEWENE